MMPLGFIRSGAAFDIFQNPERLGTGAGDQIIAVAVTAAGQMKPERGVFRRRPEEI